MLATPEGPRDLEVTIDDVHVLTDEGTGLATHTNHALHCDLARLNVDFPELIESHPRKRRLDAAVVGLAGRVDVAAIARILQDHDNYPRSICRHANPDPVTGFWETVFSVIIEPDALAMYVSRGTPCNHSYETYRL
jgi:isopenicillin-N N-acyltransferase-like protein